MAEEAWQQWEKRDIDGALADRARGVLPEMECTKQLVKLIASCYRPGMTVLDAGCNAGHYLRSLVKLDPEIKYTGVDINRKSIDIAREVFAGRPHTRFEVRDIRRSLFDNEQFDIVFCCNVILHLPDFRPPMRNLLTSTKQVCFVRTLLDERTTLAQRLQSYDFAEDTPPSDFYYMNTWATEFFIKFVEGLGWRTEIIADQFDATVLAREYDSLKKGDGTRILGGMQADGSVVYNWKWAKLTRP